VTHLLFINLKFKQKYFYSLVKVSLRYWTGYSKDQDSWLTPQNMRLLVHLTDGKRYPANAIRKQGNKYLVKYDQYDAIHNEVVELQQLSVLG